MLSHLGRQLLAGGAPEPCPEGKRHLFPKGSIATAHYLLFFVALVHILYSLLTFTLTLHRVRRGVGRWFGWRGWMPGRAGRWWLAAGHDGDGKLRDRCGWCNKLRPRARLTVHQWLGSTEASGPDRLPLTL